MASIGGLAPSKSFDSISQKFNGADAGTEIWGYCTMENNSSTNKVGRITVSTNFDGGNLNVAVGSSYGATDGASGTVGKGDSFSCYVSYLERSNYIVITVPQEIREQFTIEIAFSALTGREATFEVEQGLVYNGSLQYGIINLSNCSVANGAISGTDPGTYNCTLEANNSVKYSDCYYFNDGGVAQSQKSAVWTISKAFPNWDIAPTETNIKIGETGSVIISGTFPGLKSTEQSSPDGGQVSFLGLNGNQLSFKGTKAGTVAVIVYSKENKYYESDNRIFTVIVSKNKENQQWYYSDRTITVGTTAYIIREGSNISSATPELTIGDSNIISATINNSDGQLTVIGKAIGTSKLTVKIPADENYNEHSNEITITVIGKKEQPWNSAYGNEITIEPNGDYYISIFGSVYGGIDYITESSIIDISDKSENGCKITSNGTTGIATVTIYSPGNEEYNEKTISVTVTVIKNLQWIQINPYIYINNQWKELNPKIYKNGKWLPGTIWKYISKGDIYGK